MRLPKLPPSRRKLRVLLTETGNELDKAQAEVAAVKERLGEARREVRKLGEDRTELRIKVAQLEARVAAEEELTAEARRLHERCEQANDGLQRRLADAEGSGRG